MGPQKIRRNDWLGLLSPALVTGDWWWGSHEGLSGNFIWIWLCSYFSIVVFKFTPFLALSPLQSEVWLALRMRFLKLLLSHCEQDRKRNKGISLWCSGNRVFLQSEMAAMISLKSAPKWELSYFTRREGGLPLESSRRYMVSNGRGRKSNLQIGYLSSDNKSHENAICNFKNSWCINIG